MYESNRKPCTATRKNMKRPMTKEQFQFLLKRNRIENVWSVLKLNYNLIYHRARSVTGMFRNFFYSISAFLFHLVEDAMPWFLPYFNSVQNLNFDLLISFYVKCSSFFMTFHSSLRITELQGSSL